MRTILLFAVLFSYLSINGQQSVKFYENYFRNYIDNYTVNYYGKSYNRHQIETITDSLLNTIYKRKYPDDGFRMYGNYYFNSKSFKHTIDKIKELTLTKESYMENIGGIIERLDSLEPKGKIHAIDRLLSKYRGIKDTAFLRELNKLTTQFPVFEKEDLDKSFHYSLQALGDMYVGREYLPFALEMYCQGLIFADSIKDYYGKAYLESRIADLYLHRDVSSYRRKAADHFYKASQNYLYSGDTLQSINAKLGATRQSFWSMPAMKFEDYASFQYLIKEGKSSEEQGKIAENYMYNEMLVKVFTSAYEVLERKIPNPPIDLYYNAYTVLYEYFFNIGDLKTAKEYSILRLFFSMDGDGYSIPHVMESLQGLADLYWRENNYPKVIDAVNRMIDLGEWSGFEFQTSYAVFYKAFYVSKMGNPIQALSIARKELEFIDSLNVIDPDALRERGYSCLSNIFYDLCELDSADFYQDRFRSFQNDYTEEMDRLMSTEFDYTNGVFEKKIAASEAKLFKSKELLALVNSRVALMGKESTKLHLQIQQSKDSLADMNSRMVVQKLTNDSLTRTNSSLRFVSDSLTADINKKIILVAQLEKKSTVWRNSALGALAILVGIVFWNRDRMKRKNNKIKNTREELSALTKGKIHNIRGNYTTVQTLILKRDFEKAEQYIDKCATAFTLSLDKWEVEEKKYFLSDEVMAMNALAESEKVLGKNIEIKKDDLLVLEKEGMIFMPEVFTTLLHNSIKAKATFFTIKANKENRFVIFEISDNGRSSRKESYINYSKPNKGLTLLERRIVNIWADKKWGKKLKHSLDICIDNGTTIKFAFPYELSA